MSNSLDARIAKLATELERSFTGLGAALARTHAPMERGAILLLVGRKLRPDPKSPIAIELAQLIVLCLAEVKAARTAKADRANRRWANFSAREQTFAAPRHDAPAPPTAIAVHRLAAVANLRRYS